MDKANDFVESYFAAWNQHDAQGVVDHYTSEGVYRDVPARQQLQRDALLVQLKDYFENDEAEYSLVGEVSVGPNSIAFQYMMSRANPDQSPWYGAEFISLEGNLAKQISDYYEPTVQTISQGGRLKGIKYERSGLSSEQMNAYKLSLENLMLEQRAYRNPALTLPQLASLMGCSVNHLSQVINAGFGCSFFDYLNQYRVEEAKGLLGDETFREKTILEIAHAVGFNSNSAFYQAFKKQLGATPSSFRKKSK